MPKPLTHQISRLMEASRVTFGTSGARGLVKDMTDRVCYAYTKGFLQYLNSIGDRPNKSSAVAVAGDLRPSTGRIMGAVFKASIEMGCEPVNCGRIPSPAVAYFGISRKIPSIMVTGSHIPDDRNGIKFNKCAGEILKSDEQGLMSQEVEINEDLFDENGMFKKELQPDDVHENHEAAILYHQRFCDFFPVDFLSSRKVLFYQHSAVGRDLLPDILESLGANVECLGREDRFIPVDTEAVRPEDVSLAAKWAAEKNFHAIFTTDGDSDRPLIADEKGRWIRGDVAGVLTAMFLSADSVAVPISCNTALEKCGKFRSIQRTKIGSPYVVEAMIQAAKKGSRAVAGYEANGGFLTGTDIESRGRILTALPTRDPLIVFLAIMGLARQEQLSVSALLSQLPRRFTASGRLQDFPSETSRAVIGRLFNGNEGESITRIEEAFGLFGKVKALDITDGLRITFANEEIVHLRPSGNAPEFRCYNEADSEARAAEMNARCLEIMESWRCGD